MPVVLPLHRLTLKSWAEHEPGALVFASHHDRACACLRVEAPTRDSTTPALLLLQDAPWNARAPRGREARPGTVISDQDVFAVVAPGVSASELEVEVDPLALVDPGRVTGGDEPGAFALSRDGFALIRGGERDLSRSWSCSFDVRTGLPVRTRDVPLGYFPRWALSFRVEGDHRWRIEVTAASSPAS